MAEKSTEQAACAAESPRSACIHTNQIVDSCLDKDCVDDLRVYLTTESQSVLDRSTGAKTRCAELLFADVDVEALRYKRGHYSIDITFYYRVIADAILGGTRPTTITGLAIFSKRVVLYGGCGKAKSFRSTDGIPSADTMLHSERPTAIVEVLDPMILAGKVREVCDCRRCETEVTDIPAAIKECFGEDLVLSGESKRLYVTIGQFSTVRLERDTQLSLPILEYCMPKRECCDEECCEEDPCELFSRIDFPVRAFFPDGQSCDCQNAGGCSCGS